MKEAIALPDLSRYLLEKPQQLGSAVVRPKRVPRRSRMTATMMMMTWATSSLSLTSLIPKWKVLLRRSSANKLLGMYFLPRNLRGVDLANYWITHIGARIMKMVMVLQESFKHPFHLLVKLGFYFVFCYLDHMDGWESFEEWTIYTRNCSFFWLRRSESEVYG